MPPKKTPAMDIPAEAIKIAKQAKTIKVIKAVRTTKATKVIKPTKQPKPIKLTNEEFAKKYAAVGFVPFTLNIGIKPDGRKDLRPPKGYNQIGDDYMDYVFDNMNGMAIRAGTMISDDSHLILIDIDNKQSDGVGNGMEKWKELTKGMDIQTPTQQTANNGLHYLFKVDRKTFEQLKASGTEISIDGHKYAIDYKADKQFAIVEPSTYDGKVYRWIVDYTVDVMEMPRWLIDILVNQTEHKKPEVIVKKTKKHSNVVAMGEHLAVEEDVVAHQEVNMSDGIVALQPVDDAVIVGNRYADSEIECLLGMLSRARCDSYDEWLHVGMCLYNINKMYLILWKKWSENSPKYDEQECDAKWKTFKKDRKTGLFIGSLLNWCKHDNAEAYNAFTRRVKTHKLIYSKFPEEKLKCRDTKVISKVCSYTRLANDNCLIYGESHGEPSMYVEMMKDMMTIKCKHPECYGKIYPCEHVSLSKNEMNIIFNGDIHVNVNTTADATEFAEVKIFEDNYLNTLVFTSLNGEANSLAEIVYYNLKDVHNYGENNRWYTYENHKWTNVGMKNIKLRDSMKCKLRESYVPLLDYYEKNNDSGDNEHTRNKKIQRIKQIMKSFDNTTLKNNIMVELIDLYFTRNNPQRNFTGKLDTLEHLVGFNNGVYDMNAYEFRAGHPSDYISLSTGYDYQDSHTKEYAGLQKFLSDVLPREGELEYMLTYISTSLTGNELELFTILTGSGRNGKSKFIELLGASYGSYFVAIQSQMFTRPKPDASAPDPGMLHLLHRKIVIASEPEKNSKLNSGFIKFITGRDSTILRNCHENTMFNFRANFITMLTCNDIPDCDDIDNAFSKRLRCVNFPSEFVDNPTGKNQKQIDTNINKNFEMWRADFMLLLIEHHKKYHSAKKLVPTENILRWGRKYANEVDVYVRFLNEKTEECWTHMKTSALYECFGEWHGKNYPHAHQPNIRAFIANIKTHRIVDHVKVNKETCYGVKHIRLIGAHDDSPAKKHTHVPHYIVQHVPCHGVGGTCPYNNKCRSNKHDGYCKYCFCNLFPDDPRTKNIRTKTKEIEVINHVCMNHQGTWYHDKPIHFNFENKCCPSRRRIDLRQMIGNTMLCIEVDEHQHRSYPTYDDFVRYNELAFELTCKYIFIRYNPDQYKVHGVVAHTDTQTRLQRLSEEIRKQIDIIESARNENYLEIVHLFYDE
jgi:P4 family phage/plasmid primase-like protien